MKELVINWYHSSKRTSSLTAALSSEEPETSSSKRTHTSTTSIPKKGKGSGGFGDFSKSKRSGGFGDFSTWWCLSSINSVLFCFPSCNYIVFHFSVYIIILSNLLKIVSTFLRFYAILRDNLYFNCKATIKYANPLW